MVGVLVRVGVGVHWSCVSPRCWDMVVTLVLHDVSVCYVGGSVGVVVRSVAVIGCPVEQNRVRCDRDGCSGLVYSGRRQ